MPGPPQRLAYIDWMRGLACVLMFQTHCYDAWLSPEARKSTFFMYSQLLGTFPAPLFLFLAGISFALVTDRMRAKGAHPGAVVRTTLRRGAEIYALGLGFRLQEYLIAFPWAPWTDLFRMDVLNCIGLSMVLMALVCRLSSAPTVELARKRGVLVGAAATLAVAMLTPPLWTTWRPSWLPWPLETVLDGVHNLGAPQAWLFPVFPWSAFAFAGLAVGFVLMGEQAKQRLGAVLAGVAASGVAIFFVARWLDRSPWQLYAVYDFWHTSPNFLVMRLGILMVILLACYVWCRWGAGQWGFSPIAQLGQTSLLVYWVHIEFVYGRFSIMKKGQQTIAGASLGLATITLAMLVLSVIRTRMKESKTGVRSLFRRAAGAGAA